MVIDDMEASESVKVGDGPLRRPRGSSNQLASGTDTHEDVPATTIPMDKRKLRMVKEMTTRATEVLAVHTYRDRPQVRRKRAIWSMMGGFSMNNRNGHFSRPLNLRWRSTQSLHALPKAAKRDPRGTRRSHPRI